ncbi:helix-turn-helix domain-containing protein [Shouchella shacheensis]|uniref:helix-turn-helix domain-containing protein n=1 Tax=Shouchella shacheensis TaxID=1649580 RepID=UPI0007402FC9|nr:AraC family transcriptional regulator [Shouchella shacheensis]
MKSLTEPYKERVLEDNVLKQPIHCHMEHSPPNQLIVSSHFHDAIELLFAFSGAARVFVGGSTFTMREGDLVIVNSKEVHSIFAEDGEEEVRYLVIKLEPEVLYSTSRSIFESKYVLPFAMAKSSPQTLLSRADIEHTAIPSIIEQIMSEFYLKSYGYDFAIRIHICSIFLAVLRFWEHYGIKVRESDPYNQMDIELMQNVFRLLEEQFAQPITAKQAAEYCNLSYSYFSRKVKTITGRSFTELLNYVRVTEAEKLLTTSDLPVTEIAARTGYSTSSYFIQQFKAFKNISPYRFKKRMFAHQRE